MRVPRKSISNKCPGVAMATVLGNPTLKITEVELNSVVATKDSTNKLTGLLTNWRFISLPHRLSEIGDLRLACHFTR